MTVKNYSHEISWQTWANDIFSNRREHHALLFMLFDPLHSSLGILQTESVLAGVKHNPYAKTEVPFPTPKKRVTCCICAIFVNSKAEFKGWIQRSESINRSMVHDVKRAEQEEGTASKAMPSSISSVADGV